MRDEHMVICSPAVFELVSPDSPAVPVKVELTYDSWLRGRDGVQDLEVNAAGEVVRALGGRRPVAGRDLQLSLDLDLQVSVERALADGMRAARRLPDAQRGGTYPAPAATPAGYSRRASTSGATPGNRSACSVRWKSWRVPTSSATGMPRRGDPV